MLITTCLHESLVFFANQLSMLINSCLCLSLFGYARGRLEPTIYRGEPEESQRGEQAKSKRRARAEHEESKLTLVSDP